MFCLSSTQIDENTTEITYQGYGDPGGAVPNWLANRLIKNSSFETFVNMRKQIRIKRYQSKPEAEITEWYNQVQSQI